MIFGLAAAGLALAACAPKRAANAPDPYDRTVDAECYTVDLFTPAQVSKPSNDVPAEWHAYLGKWGGGAWEGQWCHDLYVLSISPDGQVDIISAHAPLEAWGKEATAFRRQGRITEDGKLRILYRNIELEYRLQGGKLYGDRKEGDTRMRIKLSPQNLEA